MVDKNLTNLTKKYHMENLNRNDLNTIGLNVLFLKRFVFSLSFEESAE